MLGTDGVTPSAVETIVQHRYSLAQQEMDDWLRQSAHETHDDATVVVMLLGRDALIVELDHQLERYVELSATEKQELLSRLAQSRYEPLTALLRCYELEPSEALRISLYPLMSRKITREKRIALADDAARRGQPRLLQRIIGSLR